MWGAFVERSGRVEKRRGGCSRGEELLTGGFRQVPVPQSAPLLRFLFPLIERTRIALSDWLHVRPTAGTHDRGKLKTDEAKVLCR